jgi:hypothetical protein
MPKIVLLPLDERPCNTIYPDQLFNIKDIQLVQPNQTILGQKKRPASLKMIDQFLIDETKDAYGLVISMDMLLYGGIVPSRLHHHPESLLESRYQVIETIKENNPNIIIYASDLVMRCPQYSSNDEEPDYYQQCGKEIFQTGFLGHKVELGIASTQEKQLLDSIHVPEEYLKDYLNRRHVNQKMNIKSLSYVKQGLIDFLVIPQDDAAEYGFTSKDQMAIKKIIDQYQIQSKVYIYPGADEVANVLISRLITRFHHKKPAFYLYYPSATSGQTIPLLEDQTLEVTIRSQIRSAGGRVVSSMMESDIVLFVNAPAELMQSNAFIHVERKEVERRKRNLVDFVEQIDDVIHIHGKIAAVADVFSLNGSDHELMMLLNQKGLLNQLSAYAGWNTSSNTLGTTIPFAIQSLLYPKEKQLKDFLMSRYVEDYGYMSYVKTIVNQQLGKMGMNYFDVSHNMNAVESMIHEELKKFISIHLSSIDHHIDILKVWMPWKRMFEVGVQVKYHS